MYNETEKRKSRKGLSLRKAVEFSLETMPCKGYSSRNVLPFLEEYRSPMFFENVAHRGSLLTVGA